MLDLGNLGKELMLGEHILSTAVELATTGQAQVHVKGIHIPGVPLLEGCEYVLDGTIKKVEKKSA